MTTKTILSTVLMLATSHAQAGVTFHREVANIEHVALTLKSAPPYGVALDPALQGGWYGSVMRRIAGEGPYVSGHYIPFSASYTGGRPVAARIDADMDGSLAGEPLVKLDAYPPIAGARSFLTRFGWSARQGGREIPVDWMVRIVLEPRFGEDAPIARVQHVHAMVGTIAVEGRGHRALLFDGNGDGLYSRDFFDGIFVDLNDDGHFDIDQMSPEFGPLASPFQMGGHVYEVTAVDPEGSALTLAERGAALAASPPRVGAPAPDFHFEGGEGASFRLSELRGHPVLLSFWASWCGSSLEQAPGLRALRDRFGSQGLKILGVSYDTDRSAMESFREKQNLTWPTSYAGRMFAENPIGRLYQVRSPGALFLVDKDGRLEGIYDDPDQVADRIGLLLAPGHDSGQ